MAEPVYPNGIKTYTDKVDLVDDIHASTINEAYAEIIAIETELNGHKGDLSKHKNSTSCIQLGLNSNADGYKTIAMGDDAHAEGLYSKACGMASHAEGKSTTASGDYSHAEGLYSMTIPGELFMVENANSTTKVITFQADISSLFTVGSNVDIYMIDFKNIPYVLENVPVTAVSGSTITVNTSDAFSDTVAYVLNKERADDHLASHAEGRGTLAAGMVTHAEGERTLAGGWASHAEGSETVSMGDASHAEGEQTKSLGRRSHSEGFRTEASGNVSHAEGEYVLASGKTSHAEGSTTSATGDISHAEGYESSATGDVSHAEGDHTLAEGKASHAEGSETKSTGNTSHAEGYKNISDAIASHTEGMFNGAFSREVKCLTPTQIDLSADKLTFLGDVDLNEVSAFLPIAQWYNGELVRVGTDILSIDKVLKTITFKRLNILQIDPTHNPLQASIVILSKPYIGNVIHPAYAGPHAEGISNLAVGMGSHAEGVGGLSGYGNVYVVTEHVTSKSMRIINLDKSTTISGIVAGDTIYIRSMLFGSTIKSTTVVSIEQNVMTIFDDICVPSGIPTIIFKANKTLPGDIISGACTHSEGHLTFATGLNSHAEGDATFAIGDDSHSEGYNTMASGIKSHAEGSTTKSTGPESHAEGSGTWACAMGSHAEGDNTCARGIASHSEGGTTYADGRYSHAEGKDTIAGSTGSHSEGLHTISGAGTVHKIMSLDSTNSTVTLDNVLNISPTDTLTIKTDVGSIYDVLITSITDKTLKLDTQPDESWVCVVNIKTLASDTPAHSEGLGTIASGAASHAEGTDSISSGSSSHAEGYLTEAVGDSSHAEGMRTKSLKTSSHAEGNSTTASGVSSHAEGERTLASGVSSHAEGNTTTASGVSSHAEGDTTTASGVSSHAEGRNTIARGHSSHSEGNRTISGAGTIYRIMSYDNLNKTITMDNVANIVLSDLLTIQTETGIRDKISITSITNNTLKLNTSDTIDASWRYVIRNGTVDPMSPTHSEGANTISAGIASHSEGWNTLSGNTGSHSEGCSTEAMGVASHAEGGQTSANGTCAHAEGSFSSSGTYSHAEGRATMSYVGSAYKIMSVNDTNKRVSFDSVTGLAVGVSVYIKRADAQPLFLKITAIEGFFVTFDTRLTLDNSFLSSIVILPSNSVAANHSEGRNTVAVGQCSHAEGEETKSFGITSHSEGYNTKTLGTYSHAEGFGTLTSGISSHAEGNLTTSSGENSHAEGYFSKAVGTNSHTQNDSTVAQGYAQTAIGKYNVLQGSPTSQTATDKAFIIGNGSEDSKRSNALSVAWDGLVSSARAGIMGGVPEGINYYTDFFSVASPQASCWVGTGISSGTCTASSQCGHPGVARMYSSTSVNSGYSWSTENLFMLNGGECSEFVFQINTIANTKIRLGFQNYDPTSSPTKGAWINIDNGVVSGKTSTNNSVSTTETTYTIGSNGPYYKAKVEVDSNALVKFSFYQDTTLVWSNILTTNIPSGEYVGHGVITAYSGTEVKTLLTLDFMNIYSTKPLAR